MTLLQIKSFFSNRLSALYPSNEADAIFSLICRHLLNYSKIDIHTKKETILSQEIQDRFKNIINRLHENEPIQYILGTVDFYNLTLQIDNRALIPRQETELLIDLIIRENQGKKELNIIDLCTGSGCIAIALAAHLKDSTVSATDFSKEAFNLAHDNALKNNCTISFICDSILDPQFHYKTYDIIVSNPPYVRESEIQRMEKNVYAYEPHMALFVNDSDPLLFYKAIADFADKYLKKEGILYCEINEAFGQETAQIFITQGFNQTTVLKDLNNKDRFIKASK